MTHRPHLIIVGGFLGAGKTTLILAAARLLADRGLRSAIILNDQGESLVDTELARSSGIRAGEVPQPQNRNVVLVLRDRYCKIRCLEPRPSGAVRLTGL